MKMVKLEVDHRALIMEEIISYFSTFKPTIRSSPTSKFGQEGGIRRHLNREEWSGLDLFMGGEFMLGSELKTNPSSFSNCNVTNGQGRPKKYPKSTEQSGPKPIQRSENRVPHFVSLSSGWDLDYLMHFVEKLQAFLHFGTSKRDENLF
ncbi:hypothetical protein VNO77_04014 [Canavalia gladiata]|uniref:Uncharacterized protein n=1 Tax=Canavalia gladiata TaxID=3824 RepID=A0AAN9R7E2_CANGL